MKAWTDFIESLERDVDWDTQDDAACSRVESALRQIAQVPAAIAERCAQIASDKALFEAYKPHCQYPRITMDKFMLHMDEQERFRVRLHRFKPKLFNGESVAKVHAHKFIYSTIILEGSYVERSWRVSDIDETTSSARLEFLEEVELCKGATRSGPLDVAHQTVNESQDVQCVTLFVRGRSRLKGSMIFDPTSGKFNYTYSPDRQIREALMHFSNSNAYFHP